MSTDKHVIPILAKDEGQSCDRCRHRVKVPGYDSNDQVCGLLHNKPVSLRIMSREQAEEAKKYIGSRCKWFDKTVREKRDQKHEVPVAFPLHDDVVPTAIPITLKQKVHDCGQCEHWASPADIEHLGFNRQH